MPPRIPTEADFAPLSPSLMLSLHWPNPPESTTAFLVLFHGLGDWEGPYGGFARNLALPGVLGISVRGTSPVPASLLGDPGDQSDRRHYHWGDDLNIDPSTGDLDADPGFEKAAKLVMDRLIKETIVQRCGWDLTDIILFGFGQGGSLALGLSSHVRLGPPVVDVSDGQKPADHDKRETSFKGVVSIGGELPRSMVPTTSARRKSLTPVLLCQVFDDDAVDLAKEEFSDVRVVRWKHREIAMPKDRDEVFPIMKFFAERLKAAW
jgi:hypothetical protein